MFIGGKWTGSRENERIPVYNPFNRELWATVPQASPDDVEQAVFAARRAFETVWKKSKGIDRAGLLMRLSELLRRNAERMAVLETKDNGKVIRETKVQMHFAARNYQFFAGYADKLYGEVIPLDNPHLFDYTLREPLGVVVLIISWNSPMTLLANKLAPALAAGNTVIIKPSEHASVTCLEMGKLIEEAGFPAGVVNIVTGDGTVGGLLISHPDIDKISFTGGTETGKRIAQQAGRNLVPATLELGGKSPNIIFADADLDKAVIGALAGIFAASGQTCIAGSRLLVQRPVYGEVVERLAQKSRAIKLGNPLDAATEMGPVANRQQFEKILAMIEKAKQEGAKLVQGGVIPGNPELQQGYFITRPYLPMWRTAWVSPRKKFSVRFSASSPLPMKRKPCKSPMARLTAWLPASGPRISTACSAWPGKSKRARFGSTPTARARPRRPLAA
jgi:aldehyde dehydrogenase (NAD+)